MKYAHRPGGPDGTIIGSKVVATRALDYTARFSGGVTGASSRQPPGCPDSEKATAEECNKAQVESARCCRRSDPAGGDDVLGAGCWCPPGGGRLKSVLWSRPQ